MRFITMDDEGRDLLEAASEMAHAALSARASRIDPDGLITKSLNMSRLKTKQLLDQLREPPLARYRELTPEDQALLHQMAQIDPADYDEKDWEAYFSTMRALCLRRALVDSTLSNPQG